MTLSISGFATSPEVRPPQMESKKQTAMNGISLPCGFLMRVGEHTPGHQESGPFPCGTQRFCESQSPPPHSSKNRSRVWKRRGETLSSLHPHVGMQEGRILCVSVQYRCLFIQPLLCWF